MYGSFVTKSGKSAFLRHPTLGDVKAATYYINSISSENTYITFSGEMLTEEEEEKYIRDSLEKIERGDMVKLYCFVDNELVAEGSIERDFRTRKRGIHRAMIGITVKKEFREQGIGKALMLALIEEAKEKIPGIKLVILTVFGTNEKAINLYKSLGFVEYGRLPEGLFYKDKYVDYVYMHLRINPNF
jgi:RimJ/RimL family protein N-acetyltransferase